MGMWLELHRASQEDKSRPLYWGCERYTGQAKTKAGSMYLADDYVTHTHQRTFMPYMVGSGYVLDGRLATMLSAADEQVGLALHPLTIEDATMGMWLIPYNLNRQSRCKRFINSTHRKKSVDA